MAAPLALMSPKLIIQTKKNCSVFFLSYFSLFLTKVEDTRAYDTKAEDTRAEDTRAELS